MAEGRLFAIGDIHGCLDELVRLLDAIPATAADTIAFVGDYIDRGTDSRGVVEHLLAWRERTPATAVFLKGNHEDMALAYMGFPGHWGEAWLRNGGVAALRSYDLDPHGSRRDIAAGFPADHLAFFSSLQMMLHWGDFLLVHAGIRPGVALAAQHSEDLLWIREEFLEHPHDLGQTVVFGHTPHRRVVVGLPYRIGIDTGCVYGGALSCVVLPEGHVYQVRLGDTVVRESPLNTTHGRRP